MKVTRKLKENELHQKNIELADFVTQRMNLLDEKKLYMEAINPKLRFLSERIDEIAREIISGESEEDEPSLPIG